ncbi:MAG: hypothetical protein H8E25_07495 [Planctomycetes bacterium]|nr:hypothetical protein [Planctomycetota bacterium]
MKNNCKRRRGFTLTELLVFICVLSSLALLFIPMALQQRSDENEKHAVRYLQMICGAQKVWHTHTDSYVSLQQLSATVPVVSGGDTSSVSVLRAPFLALTPPMVVGDTDIAHRGGYRFQLGKNNDGTIIGCWAWPNLNKYSGHSSFWVDFSSATVSLSATDYSWKDTPQQIAPLSGQLVLLKSE